MQRTARLSRVTRLSWKHASVVIIAAIAMTPATGSAAPIVSITANGPLAVPGAVESFLSAIGSTNNGTNACTPVPCTGGHRRITWDGGGPNSPDPLPGDAFNQPAGTPGLERGLTATTEAGAHFEVSAAEGEPGFEFGTVNSQYPNIFQSFSSPKLFAPIGSIITDVTFSQPGQPGLAATTNGFGVVFTDVDALETTGLEFFGVAGNSLGSFFARTENNGLSFLGVSFGESIVARVRIISGNTPLGPNNIDGFFDDLGLVDVVAMDDFFYGEPVSSVEQPAAVPEPTSMLLLGTGLLGTVWHTRQRARRV